MVKGGEGKVGSPWVVLVSKEPRHTLLVGAPSFASVSVGRDSKPAASPQLDPCVGTLRAVASPLRRRAICS